MSDEQLAAISTEVAESGSAWSDSFCLEPLLCTAHEHGVLRDVWIYQILDDRNIFLVSVQVAPAVFAHAMPVTWYEVCPDPDRQGADAVRQVLERLAAISSLVIQSFRITQGR